MICPKCGNPNCDHDGKVSYEKTGWDGNSYKADHQADAYVCPNCGTEFFVVG